MFVDLSNIAYFVVASNVKHGWSRSTPYIAPMIIPYKVSYVAVKKGCQYLTQ